VSYFKVIVEKSVGENREQHHEKPQNIRFPSSNSKRIFPSYIYRYYLLGEGTSTDINTSQGVVATESLQ
jgi:hypothetical protein